MLRKRILTLTTALAAAALSANPALAQLHGEPVAGHPSTNSNLFGVSVATDGEYLVVGASGFASQSGNAYLFQINEDKEWSYIQDLRSILSTVLITNDQFGRAVAISNGAILVGAPGRKVGAVNNHGEVFTFAFDEGAQEWTATGTLSTDNVPPEPGEFGLRIAFDGQTALVGAPTIGSSAGSVFFYERSGENWSESQRVDMPGGVAGVCFGDSVAVRGDLAVVGAPKHGEPLLSGRAFVYRRIGAEWVLEEVLGAASPTIQSRLGAAAATNGSSVILGAPHLSNPTLESVRIFRYDDGVWTTAESFLNPDPATPGFGLAVNAFGNIAVAGAHSNSAPGAAYILRQEIDSKMGGAELIWTLEETLLPAVGQGAVSDRFGAAVAVSPPKESGSDPLDPTLVEIAVGAFATLGLPGNAYTWQVEDFGPLDCNENGVPDFIDIDTGFSADCNMNMIPDECEPTVHFVVTGYNKNSPVEGLTIGGAQLIFDGTLFPNGMQGMSAWFEHDGVMIPVPPDQILAQDPDKGTPSCEFLILTVPAFPPPCECATTDTFDADIIFMDRGGHMFRLSEIDLSFTYINTKLFVSPGQQIQDRIDAADEGMCIVVNPGVYTENLTFPAGSSKITLTSTNLDSPGQTRIRGGSSFTPDFPTIEIQGPTSHITICGINITLGKSGVRAIGGAQATLYKNRIENNIAADSHGGGVLIEGAETFLKLDDNVIVLNRSDGVGGGVAIFDGDALIVRNRIFSNISNGGGGGIALDGGAASIYSNNIFANDAGGAGGGLSLRPDFATSVRDNRVAENFTASNSGAGIYFQSNAPLTVFANDIDDNFAAMGANFGEFPSNGGGGIFLSGEADVLVAVNRIVNNQIRGSGGGVFSDEMISSLIENNLIESNLCWHHLSKGGGVYFGTFSLGVLSENIIKFNNAQKGGGVMADVKGEPLISRNVIAYNTNQFFGPFPNGTPTFAPAILIGDTGQPVGPAPNIVDNTFYQNISTELSGAHSPTGAMHGFRVGLFEPDWAFNIISSGPVDPMTMTLLGVRCDEGVNTGVRINFNLSHHSTDFIDPNCEIPGGPMMQGNQMGDPMFVDPANCDFRVLPSSPARVISGEHQNPIGAAKPDGLVCIPVGQIKDTGSETVIKFPPIDDDDDNGHDRPDMRGDPSDCGVLPIVATEVYIDVRHLPRRFTFMSDGDTDASTLFVDIKTIYGNMNIGPDGYTLCIPTRAPMTPGQNVTLFRSTTPEGPFLPLGVVGTVDESGELVEFPGLTTTGMHMGQGVITPYIFVGAHIGPDCNGNGVPDDDDPTPCVAESDCVTSDINRDGVVNTADLAMLLAAWGSDDEHCDLNGDGVINAQDLGILLSDWGAKPVHPCRN